MKVLTAVYDRVAETYGDVYTTRTKGEAIRAFLDETEREGSTINKHPGDYELHEIATYDEETGTVSPQKNLLTKGKDFSS